MFEHYYKNTLSALDAKFEAQKLAFAPVSFQVAKAMVDMNILKTIEAAKTTGISKQQILTTVPAVSPYALTLLLEISLSLELVKLTDKKTQSYVLGKIGYFLLNDELTRVNMNFMHDVCYEGLFSLQKSFETGKPEGLKTFGSWNTIYEGLADLPERAKKSWFEFDHYYSDCIYDDALPLVFQGDIKHIVDIGSNTGKFTHAALLHTPESTVTMVDLEKQLTMAKQNPDLQAFQQRISYFPTNILDKNAALPTQADAVWMSQFLDCFSLSEITAILQKIKKYMPKECAIFVLEPLWDKQRFLAAAFSLQATSAYFAALANGNSKMYSFEDLKGAVEHAGFSLVAEHHNLGIHYYSLLRFKIL